jgi:hypothetical protein
MPWVPRRSLLIRVRWSYFLSIIAPWATTAPSPSYLPTLLEPLVHIIGIDDVRRHLLFTYKTILKLTFGINFRQIWMLLIMRIWQYWIINLREVRYQLDRIFLSNALIIALIRRYWLREWLRKLCVRRGMAEFWFLKTGSLTDGQILRVALNSLMSRNITGISHREVPRVLNLLVHWLVYVLVFVKI